MRNSKPPKRDAPKRPSNQDRFTVQSINSQFVIFDSKTLTYTECAPGTSRAEAKQQCAIANGNPPKSIEPTIWRQFRARGVTMEDLDAHAAEGARAVAQHRQPDYLRPAMKKREKRAIDDYKNWLPPLLRMWADQLADQLGYGGSMRGSLHPHLVIRALKDREFIASFKSFAAMALHDVLWPHGTDLAVHHLSTDTAEAKADFFQVSKSTYLRRVRTAHELLAQRFVTGIGVPAEEDDEWWLENGDDYWFSIEMADFAWQKS